MKTLHKLLIGSALIIAANLASAQATNTATMPGSPAGPATTATMPATAPTSATSPDPYVQKRNADKAAKTEYNEKKAASKAEHKEEKRAAKSELKAEKRDAAKERATQLSTTPKTGMPTSGTGK